MAIRELNHPYMANLLNVYDAYDEKFGDFLIIIFRMQTPGFFSVRKNHLNISENIYLLFAILQLYLTIDNIILTICYFSGKYLFSRKYLFIDI